MASELKSRAQGAQDELGWANMTDPMEFGPATVALARVVTEMAAEIDRLSALMIEEGKGDDQAAN